MKKKFIFILKRSERECLQKYGRNGHCDDEMDAVRANATAKQRQLDFILLVQRNFISKEKLYHLRYCFTISWLVQA